MASMNGKFHAAFLSLITSSIAWSIAWSVGSTLLHAVEQSPTVGQSLQQSALAGDAAPKSTDNPGANIKLQATKALAQTPQNSDANRAHSNPFEKLLTQLIAMKKFVWVAIIVAFIQGRRMLRKLEEEKAREAKQAEEANSREAFKKTHDWRY
jgi:hypothetical protein